MSAFVVDDMVINRVLTHFSRLDPYSSVARTLLGEVGINASLRDDLKRLGTSMRDLNCNAVNQRYSDADDMMPDGEYAFRMKPSTPVQVYKSLQCWLYQCSEGDVPETSLLYQSMAKIAGQIAAQIVMDLPAYDKAEW